MVTKKTPPHKRIRRAEQGREEWKIKAIKRREENQKLRAELQDKNSQLQALNEEVQELKVNLETGKDKIAGQDLKIEKLKKKIL